MIDSIIKGFPIGTFIYWQTTEELRHVKDIGNFNLPLTPKGHIASYILDGQQRITSLYAVRKGLRIRKEDGQEIDYKDISIDLSLDPDSDDQIVSISPPDDAPTISIFKLLNGSIVSLMKDYTEAELEKIDVYQSRLTNYDFSLIVIGNEYPIDIAVEVFTRINTGGTELTLFEIMVAKTYDEGKDFDLAYEYDHLISNNGSGKDLTDANYETIPPSTILQCVAIHLGPEVRRKDILKLDKYEFIDSWQTVKDGIFAAVDFLRNYLRIPVSHLLPYNSILVPLTYFFIRNKGKNPSSRQAKLLVQYFWWASLSNRFSSAVESKLAADRKRMDNILAEKQPSYRGEEVELVLDNLMWYWFSTGDAFCKAVLCLYAYFHPESFDTGSLVRIDNSWLRRSNSKNYHHFFPKSYLRKQKFEDWEANSILNITIVDDFLNKRQIGAKAPSKYMKQFAKNNKDIDHTMQTHLIDDLRGYGVWKDDYYAFIERRGKRVLEELNKRLNPNL